MPFFYYLSDDFSPGQQCAKQIPKFNFFVKTAPYIRFIFFDSFRFISIYFFTQNHPFVWEINSVCIDEEFHFVVDKILL